MGWILLVAASLVLTCVSWPANALQSFIGNVQQVQGTFMPGSFTFSLSDGNAACPAGKQLTWINSNPDNVKAVYATVVTAIASSKKIYFFMDDDDTSCTGRFIYIIN
jgi:hypothetical protein